MKRGRRGHRMPMFGYLSYFSQGDTARGVGPVEGITGGTEALHQLLIK